MSLLPVEDALERLLKSARPPDRSESVPLHEACDRVLAVDVAARLTQPPSTIPRWTVMPCAIRT